MVTISQAVVAAYVVGVLGVLLGAAIVATVRSDQRLRRREVYPPTRLERLLSEELGREADRLERDR